MPRYNSVNWPQDRSVKPSRLEIRNAGENRPGIVSTPYWTQVKDWRQKKTIAYLFSGSGSKRIGFIKWTQKRATPFLAAFCCLWVLFAIRANIPELTAKTRFHGHFCIWHIVFYVACGILWTTTNIFTAFPGRSATRQPKNMYLFKTQSKWNRNFDPDFSPSGFGVTSFLSGNFFVKKSP